MFKRKAQSSFEFAVLIMVVIGAMIVGGIYLKRGVQGRWKAAVDEIGQQYDPAFMNSMVMHVLYTNTETHIYTVPAPGNAYWTMRKDETTGTDSQYGQIRVGVTPQ